MPQNIHNNSWFFPLTTANQLANLRLFTFHHAGGSASMFRPWAQDLTPLIDIISIQLPGHGTRFAEPLLYDLKSLVNSLVENFSDYFDKPFIFFGHNMGAFISFELVRALRRERCPLPHHLIVSGACAPHLPARRRKIHCLPDSEFISELFSYNGIPLPLLEDKEILEFLIPVIRADFTIFENYIYLMSFLYPAQLLLLGG